MVGLAIPQINAIKSHKGFLAQRIGLVRYSGLARTHVIPNRQLQLTLPFVTRCVCRSLEFHPNRLLLAAGCRKSSYVTLFGALGSNEA